MAITLRPYQDECINRCWEDLEAYQKIGAVLPTGSGKSIIQIELIDKMVPLLGFDECIVIVSHITDVSMQLRDEYQKHGKHPKATALLHGAMNPGFSSKIIFSTMQTSSRGERIKTWQEKAIARKPRLIIIDEAHVFGARSYEILCDQFFPNAKVVGFSATPFRENRYSFSQFDNVSFSIDINTLVDQGYLTPPRLIQIKFDSSDDSERLHNCVEIWEQKEKPRGLCTVIYLPDTTVAKEWSNVFEFKCRTAYIDGKTPRERSKNIYKKAREGEIDVIVNCRKLETGIDIPRIGAIMMPYHVGSVTSYLQRVGRALRLFLGKEYAHIYVFGSSPSIAKGVWKHMHNFATNVRRDPDAPGSKLQDELDWLLCAEERDTQRIEWTQTQIEAVEKLAARELFDVSSLLEYKKFPNKFSRAIMTLCNSAGELKPDQKPATPMQLWKLQQYGFKAKDIQTIKSGDANALITSISKYLLRDPFIVPYGPMQGKHISETPSMYRARIKDRNIKKLFYDWCRAGRPEPSC